MKIALFSPYLSNNYGTVLQAYALQSSITKLGYESLYINWKLFGKGMLEKFYFLLKHPFFYFYLKEYQNRNRKDLSYSFLNDEMYVKTYLKNKKFVDSYIGSSSEVYSYDGLRVLNHDFDNFIVGSDQTWSPYAFYRYSPYFLSFVKNTSRINSYGCSFGTNKIPKFFFSFLKKKLNRFNGLSCRDKVNVEVLSNLISRDIQYVVDPTLLLNASDWRSKMISVRGLPNEFILCYILGERDCISEYADKLSSVTGLPVYYILTRPKYERMKNVLSGIGVQEFIWLIDNAKYVVTDSFHGTIFSLNLSTNFVSFDKFQGNSLDNGRILDVLSTYNLSSHYRKGSEEFALPADVRFSEVHDILNDDRQRSFEYLKNICSL